MKRAQKGIFLYTKYGMPLGPGADPFDRLLSIDLNYIHDSGPVLNGTLGGGGRGNPSGGRYVVSRNSSE